MRTRNSGRRNANGVLRTLDVLRALNAVNGATVAEIYEFTKISRPALYRIVDQFQSAGYVKRDDRGGIHLTHLVRSLSDGFHDDDRIAEAAVPILQDLQKQVLWPADLAVYANHAMYVRETTRRQSRLVMDRVQVGLRLPIFSSAVGLAYIAFCSERERGSIIEALRASDRPEDQIARNRKQVDSLIQKTRAEGYGSRNTGSIPGLTDVDTAAIAVPLRQDDEVRGCIVITFFSKIMTTKEAAARYLSDLRSAAAQIEQNVAQRS